MHDLSLASQVQAALWRVPGLNTLDLQMRAEGKAVCLEGAVCGSHWAALATQTAKTVPGVDTVTCRTSEHPLLDTPPPRV